MMEGIIDKDMGSAWVTLRAYSEKEDAMVAIKALEAAKIPAQVDVNAPNFDPTYANNVSLDTYRLMVAEAYLAVAQQIIDSLEPSELYENEHDMVTYLESFDDEDLLQLLYSDDVHNADMLVVARQLVMDRKLFTDEAELDTMIHKKQQELYSPKPVDTRVLIYCVVLGLMGGPIGIIICLYIMFSKGTDPRGVQYKRYDERGRANARNILIATIVAWGSLIFWMVYGPYM